MKKSKSIIMALLLALVFLFANPSQINALDNFEINDLQVSIFVNEDGSYDIVEKYQMNFTAPALGFYRDIPSYYKMRFTDENTTYNKRYYFPISNIELEGDVYYVEDTVNGKQIVVGPDDGPRFTGLKDYVIKYKILSQSLDLPSQKEAFFLNLVADWTAPIHNFKASVEFENPVANQNLIVKGQTFNQELDLNCASNAKGFTCEYNDTMIFYPGNGITANLPLADDYYNRSQSSVAYFLYVIIGLSLLALALIFKLFVSPALPLIKKVMFTAPKGFNGPMITSVYKSMVTMTDAQSIIFEWASKGYILIDEREDGLYFKKLTEINTKNNSEAKLFNTLFTDMEFVSTKDWKKLGAYEAFSSFMASLTVEVKKIVEISDKKSYAQATILSILSVLAMYIFTIVAVNKTIQSYSTSALLALIYLAVVLVGFIIFRPMLSAAIKNGESKYNFIFTIIFGIFAYFAMSFMAKLTIYGIRLDTFYYPFIMALMALALATASFIGRRTQAGSDVYGEILGLRDFIKYAKVDELKVMQAENPSLYYDVLPYAYAFGMSDLWSNHFKTLEVPSSQYYRSYNPSLSNYLIMRSMMNSMNSSMRSFTPPPTQSRSGGGSFSGGGGFSGGFSGGGGFGGGGGGGR